LKARAENFSGALALDPSIIVANLTQVAHDIAYREALTSVGGLVLTPSVQNLLRERLGHERAAVFLQWLKDVGQMRGPQVSSHARALARFMRQLRNNVVVGTLGYAADIVFGDVGNLAGAVAFLGPRHWAAGLSDFLAHPFEQHAFALERSGELRARHDALEKDFRVAVATLTRRGNIASRTLDWYKDHAFDFFAWSEAVIGTPAWLGAYRKKLAETGSEKEAIEAADYFVRSKIFPARSPVDMSAVLRDKGFVGSSLLFHGFVNAMHNVNRDVVHDLYVATHGKSGKDAAIAVAKKVPKVAGTLMAFWIGWSVLGELLTGRGPEEDDGEDELERWRNWFVRKLLMAPIAGIPWIAGPLESIILGRRPSVRTAPGFALADRLGRAVFRAIENDEVGLEEIAEIGKALGVGLGIPMRPARAVEYAVGEEGLAEDVDQIDPAGVVEGLIYGDRTNRAATPLTPLTE
jgi:hypothetical protein